MLEIGGWGREVGGGLYLFELVLSARSAGSYRRGSARAAESLRREDSLRNELSWGEVRLTSK